MRNIASGFKAIFGLIHVEPDTARADQCQIRNAIADQIGQLPLRMEKLSGQSCKCGEAGPASPCVQGEKTAHGGLGDDPFQLPVSIEIRQCLAQ